MAALELLSAAAPRMIVIDHAHWLDQESRDALGFVERILAEVRRMDLTARQRAMVTWLPSAFDDGVGEGAADPGELVALAEAMVADGGTGLGLRIFWSVAMRCFWVEHGQAVRDRIAALARWLPVDRAIRACWRWRRT